MSDTKKVVLVNLLVMLPFVAALLYVFWASSYLEKQYRENLHLFVTTNELPITNEYGTLVCKSGASQMFGRCWVDIDNH